MRQRTRLRNGIGWLWSVALDRPQRLFANRGQEDSTPSASFCCGRVLRSRRDGTGHLIVTSHGNRTRPSRRLALPPSERLRSANSDLITLPPSGLSTPPPSDLFTQPAEDLSAQSPRLGRKVAARQILVFLTQPVAAVWASRTLRPGSRPEFTPLAGPWPVRWQLQINWDSDCGSPQPLGKKRESDYSCEIPSLIGL